MNNYYRIKSLNKVCFSEPEEVKAASKISEWSEQSNYETGYESERSEHSDDESEINDEVCDESEICDESERSEQSEWNEQSEINTSTNKKPIITDKEYENDLRIILKQAIKNNDRQLMTLYMNY